MVNSGCSKIVFVLLLTLILYNCSEDRTSHIKIDFIQKESFSNFDTDSVKFLKVGVSAIISPIETFKSYQKLLNYVSQKIGKKIQLIQRKTYKEINNLLEAGELDFAFICSGAYVDLKEKNNVEIIAVPTNGGKPYYQAYIITSKNEIVSKFDDFKGKSFAFTDPLSNTGKLYAIKKLKEKKLSENDFFSKVIYTYSHDNSILLVNKGLVNGATVDGLIYNYLKKFHPEQIKNIKVIEKSEYYGIPPIVTLSKDEAFIKQIRNVLFEMHKDEAGKKLLENLLIDRFIEGNDTLYNSIRAMKKLTLINE